MMCHIPCSHVRGFNSACQERIVKAICNSDLEDNIDLLF